MATKTTDLSSEERIKEAARNIFTKKGYAAARTRDIAREAGINLALLNYYFRSKEQLFELVMLENFGQFISGVRSLLHDKKSTLDEKIEALADFYISQLIANPDLPLFIINQLHTNPAVLLNKGFTKDILLRSHFVKQLSQELRTQKKSNPNPLHFVMNLFSMIILPFIASPLIRQVGNLSEKQFKQVMEERRKLIPLWIKNMIHHT
jgi:AcrR family transcriptional regulator